MHSPHEPFTGWPIGVMLDSFRLPVPQALEKAAALGAQGFQMYAGKGDRTPKALTPDKRRELREMVASFGLSISALCGDLGHGFGDPAKNPDLVERSKRILELALDLGTDVVTTHIGVVPADPHHPRYAVMTEACGTLSRCADSMGAHFAVETGPETAETLRRFLDGLGSNGVGVNLDPANLVMVVGDDPAAAVHTLKDYIVHTHAKDGRRLQIGNPEHIYAVTPMPESLKDTVFFEELPLGQGDVDWPAYLAALRDIGYRGYLTVEREVGEHPEEDIAAAMTFLRQQTKEVLR